MARDLVAEAGYRHKGLNRNSRTGVLRGPTDEAAAARCGFVYYMTRDDFADLIKIGFSCNPRQRQLELSQRHFGAVQIIGVEIGTMLLERQLHVRFEDYHIGGEWFVSNPELRARIDQLYYGPRFQQELAELMAHLHWPQIPTTALQW